MVRQVACNPLEDETGWSDPPPDLLADLIGFLGYGASRPDLINQVAGNTLLAGIIRLDGACTTVTHAWPVQPLLSTIAML